MGGIFKNIGSVLVTVNTKYELNRLIEKTIEKEGPDCDLNFIDTSRITDMSYLFNGPYFSGDISCWDVSNVEDMCGMFYNSCFNGDISKWDVSKVKNMRWMFDHSSFNNNISGWDVSKVKNMDDMFSNSKLEELGKLPIWYKQSAR